MGGSDHLGVMSTVSCRITVVGEALERARGTPLYAAESKQQAEILAYELQQEKHLNSHVVVDLSVQIAALPWAAPADRESVLLKLKAAVKPTKWKVEPAGLHEFHAVRDNIAVGATDSHGVGRLRLLHEALSVSEGLGAPVSDGADVRGHDGLQDSRGLETVESALIRNAYPERIPQSPLGSASHRSHAHKRGVACPLPLRVGVSYKC